jgi:serine/threonine protein phosphatase PrpC
MPVARVTCGKRELEFCCATTPGPGRQTNEDSCDCVAPADPVLLARRGILAVVADGMGGGPSGDLAAGVAIAAIQDGYYASADTAHEALRSSFLDAHRAIHASAALDPSRCNMASTGAALGLTGLQAWGAWVGDSRIHLVREGEIHQLTEDQTFVRAMVSRGILTAEQAAKHPQRNVLLHVLGHEKEPVIAVWNEPLAVQSGDSFLLTSDGAHSLVAPAELCEAVTRALDLESAAARILELAIERGGRDDASVVLARVL